MDRQVTLSADVSLFAGDPAGREIKVIKFNANGEKTVSNNLVFNFSKGATTHNNNHNQ